MRFFRYVGISLALFIGSAVGDDAGLIGRWRSVEVSKGGIGAMYEFRRDGTATFSPGATVESKYRLEGDTMIWPPATTNGPEQRVKIAWRGDDYLRLIQSDGSEETLQRSGIRTDANKLMGEWVGSRDMADTKVEMRMRFSPDGTMLLLIPFLRQAGHYTASAGKLNADFGQRGTLIGSYTFDGGVLAVIKANNRVTRLVRY